MNEPITFRHPKSWGWRFVVSAPIWLFGCLGIIYVSLAARSPFALVLVPLAVYGLLHVAAKILLFASSISITSDGLRTTQYLGPAKTVAWDDLATVEQYRKFAFDYREIVRITSRRKGGSILFTDAISNFPQLMQAVASHAPDARRTKLPLPLRAILG